jgi:hypothetical protein
MGCLRAGPGGAGDPTGVGRVASACSGDIIASVDSSGDIPAFSKSGVQLWSLNVGGYPTGITRDDSGNAYVADLPATE